MLQKQRSMPVCHRFMHVREVHGSGAHRRRVQCGEPKKTVYSGMCGMPANQIHDEMRKERNTVQNRQ